MKKIILLLIASSFLAYSQERKNVDVTIYNTNLGVVKETREINLKNGTQEVFIRDVPTGINTSSVKIVLDGKVIEQNYRYDLANPRSLMKHFIDKKIKLISKDATIEGTLISASSNSVVINSIDGGLIILPSLEGYNIALDYMPEGLLTKPTLVWKVQSAKSGNQDAKLTYQTSGMSWEAEYVATLNKDDNKLDLNAWVNVTNNSGGTFKNANLKLMAGDINKANVSSEDVYRQREMIKSAYSPVADMVEEKNFFEYHIYEVANKTDLLNNENKQIGMFNANDISVVKKFIYNSRGSFIEKQKPTVSIEFKNSKENNLGLPIPKGIVRIYKDDGESVELVGEDNVDHTAKNEEMELMIGEAFDITIDEKVVNSKKISDKVREIEYELEVRNSKDEDIEVEINRQLWSNWEVLSSNIDFVKENSNKISFKVKVGENDKNKLTYKIRFVY
ncbi:MAG: DUF4139 domain-containing protein [Chlorobiota bacterium]